ncbi:DUF937 domain-containing protein [Sphingobacterium deserti]|uniref:DUF937 domain-containing protein n=1 Tax=Sphingobacterium deserti TaxID=1229276 RepID=A0A0B8T449_9SPHI|nr:DUF937 domain-containing protein [Sphingobacterium deserti]KGE16151.1 hypothetical protein DI53_0266 [Sphingobacterium deserti]
MNNSLITAVKSIFQDDKRHALANNMGETPLRVDQSLDAIIPIVLVALQRKDKSQLQNILTKAETTFAIQDSQVPSTDFAHSTAAPHELLDDITANNSAYISDSLHNYLGIDGENVQTLFAAALPAIFSALTKGGQHWDVDYVKGLLDSNQDDFVAQVPADLTPVLIDTHGDAGFHNSMPPATPADAIVDPTHTSPPQHSITEQAPLHTSESVKKTTKNKGIWWLLILVFIVALWVVFGKGCNGNSTTDARTDTLSVR